MAGRVIASHWRSGIVVVLASTVASGCAPVRDEVPVAGAPGELEQLIGTWTGEYQGSESGRSGSLQFELTAGADTAHGHVLMVPAPESMPRGTGGGEAVAEPGRVSPTPIAIRFVRLRNRTVEGVLEPYTDPACRCEVTTTFTGSIDGNRIQGTFETRKRRDGSTERGTWRAWRSK